MRRRWVVLGAAAAVVVATAAVLVGTLGGSNTSGPRREADSFLAAWERDDVATMSSALDAPPANLASLAGSLYRSAPGTVLTITGTRLSGGGSTATADYHAHADLAGFGAFEWDSRLALVRLRGAWRVRWQPADLFP